MRELGISIYPDVTDEKSNLKYIEKASNLGFTKIFTNLISVDDRKKLDSFKNIINFANEKNMKVIADINPQIMKSLNIDYRNLTFFHELGLYGIRLDENFSGNEESIMSLNPYNLKIELNLSATNKTIENIISYKPNLDNLSSCHNFYPHKYTGLSRKLLLENSEKIKKLGIRTSAFVSSNYAKFGPWPVEEGLPTLEEHRNLPIVTQAKDLWNTGYIDDIIISNCFPSDEELEALANLDRNIITLKVETIDNLPEVENKILFDMLHFARGDMSEYMIRSTQSRVIYKDNHFDLLNPKAIKVGDILIDSHLYTRYAGELQIALKPMENSGKTSVVGRIVPEEIYLLSQIKPWQKFKLEKA